MASRFTGSSSMKISSKLWCISSATVIFSPCFLFASVTIFPLPFPAILPPGISLKILRRNREWLVRNGYHSAPLYPMHDEEVGLIEGKEAGSLLIRQCTSGRFLRSTFLSLRFVPRLDRMRLHGFPHYSRTSC